MLNIIKLIHAADITISSVNINFSFNESISEKSAISALISEVISAVILNTHLQEILKSLSGFL